MLRTDQRSRSSLLGGVFLALTLVAPGGCSRQPKEERPNIIWIVWDTVRADRMSLYGHGKPTTPFLEKWAKGARVFDNCVSISATTVPSHASMFTGLLPTEHGVFNNDPLADGLTTVAELLGDSGYRTYLFAANPYISELFDFHQGFDRAERPTDPKYFKDAVRIVRSKIQPQDRSHNLTKRIQEVLQQGKVGGWPLKACGELAQRGVEEWLADSDSERPFFIFLNYMEAHRPYVPAETYRRKMMTPQQVEASYQVDRTWDRIWAYTFGLGDYSRQEIELIAATYDASVAELDALLENLLTSLESAGRLENTVVILTADHGEQLGEHHMLDHQFSLYEPLLDVPLVIHYPKKFEPGRDGRPVMNLDLFPTVLELAGLDPPVDSARPGVSLTAPVENRTRLAEYPMPQERAIDNIKEKNPDLDPSRWRRQLRAWYEQPYKYIWASDGQHELYDLAADPQELRNLAVRQADVAKRLHSELDQAVAGMTEADWGETPEHTIPEEVANRLKSLGYLPSAETGDDEANPEPPTTQPTTSTSTSKSDTDTP
ncbi:MAG: sulfatase-like hydrolase/transferase [bacterium]|nr:sulfatase-like hydrolase/transferase [bacterium]